MRAIKSDACHPTSSNAELLHYKRCSLPTVLHWNKVHHSNRIALLDVKIPKRRMRKSRTLVQQHDPDYDVGGYFRGQAGMFLAEGRYTLVSILGRGHFSTVWLCTDNAKEKDRRLVAIKISRDSKYYASIARQEQRSISHIMHVAGGNMELIVYSLHAFSHPSKNGVHYCIVFPVMVGSLWSAIRRFRHKALPVCMVRRFTACALSALRFLHENAKLIHTDIKPDNLLVPPTATSS